jgi:hypothetical protein
MTGFSCSYQANAPLLQEGISVILQTAWVDNRDCQRSNKPIAGFA